MGYLRSTLGGLLGGYVRERLAMSSMRLLGVVLAGAMAWGCGGREVTTPGVDPESGVGADDPAIRQSAPAETVETAPPRAARRNDDCEGGEDDPCPDDVVAAPRPAHVPRAPSPAKPLNTNKKARAAKIVRELHVIQRMLLTSANNETPCEGIAIIVAAWVELYDHTTSQSMANRRGNTQQAAVSDIQVLVQAARDLGLPPGEAIGEVEQAFAEYRAGLERWDALASVRQCAEHPEVARIPQAALARTLGSLPRKIDDLFPGADAAVAAHTTATARAELLELRKAHPRGLALMRGLVELVATFADRVEKARDCAATFDAVRAWNKDKRYQTLVSEAEAIDFAWQGNDDEVEPSMRAEAVKLNKGYRAALGRLLKSLEAQEACFETGEGAALASALNEGTLLEDFESIF